MRDRLQLWLKTITEKWKGFSRTRKIQIIAIAAGVLLALVLALFLALRTDWQPVVRNVDANSAAQISAVLDDAGIRNTTNLPEGEVLVPAGQVDAAQMAIAASPAMRDQRFTFQMVLDNSGMGVTAGVQHEMILRSREGEVAMFLEGTDIIAEADVGLNLPNVPTFMQAQTPSSASVRVTPTRPLTAEDGEAIAVMTARMVDGLSVDNVVVTDNNLNILFRDGQPVAGTFSGGMSQAMFFEMHVRDQILNSVLEVLRLAFNEVNVAVSADIDWNTVNQIAQEFTSPLGPDNPNGLTNWEEVIRRQAITNDDGVGGEPGLGPNGFDVPGNMFPGGDGMGGAMIFEAEDRRDHIHNMVETIISSGEVPGQLITENSSVAVTATNHIVHDEVEVRERGLLDEMTWEEYQGLIGNIGNTPEIFEHPEIETLISLVQAATGIPNVVIMSQNIHHFENEIIPPLPLDTIILFSLILLFVGLMAFALIRRTAPEVVEEIEPELSVEDLLVSSQLEEAREAEMERLAEIKYAGDSNVKEQIDKFAKEKPESVAQLLRNWINEDWE